MINYLRTRTDDEILLLPLMEETVKIQVTCNTFQNWLIVVFSSAMLFVPSALASSKAFAQLLWMSYLITANALDWVIRNEDAMSQDRPG